MEPIERFNEKQKLSQSYYPQFFDNDNLYYVEIIDNRHTVQCRQ